MDLDRRQLLAMGLLAVPGTASMGAAADFEFDKRDQPKPGLVMKVQVIELVGRDAVSTPSSPEWWRDHDRHSLYVKQIVGCTPDKWHVEYVTDVRFAARLPLDTNSASFTCAANAVKDVGGMEIAWMTHDPDG